MQNVIALVRVSTEEQAVEGRSGIERQWRDIDRVCEREHLNITQRFALEGVSGSTVKLHPTFQKVLKAVASPGCTGLVIASPDRLMRCSDLSDLAVLQPFGDESKPRLIWTGDATYNLRKLDGQLLFLMQTLMAGNDKKQIIARTQAGKQMARAAGNKCADKPPDGVKFIVTDSKAATGYYMYTGEAQRVKRAFKRVMDRDIGVRGIARELGYKTYQTLRKQLSNPIWTGWRVSDEQREKLPPGPNGELRYRRIKRAEPIRVRMELNGKPPLITEEVFNRVQGILAEVNRSHVSRRSGKPLFALSGLLRCPCGAPYYSKHDLRRGKSGYYVCRSGYNNSSKGCGTKNLKREVVDGAVIDLLVENLASEKKVLALITDGIAPQDAKENRDEEHRLAAEIETLTNRRTKMVDKIIEGIVTDAEARISLAKIRNDLERDEANLAEIRRKLKGVVVPNLNQIVTSVAGLFKGARTLPPARKRDLIRKVVRSIQMGSDSKIASISLRLDSDLIGCHDISRMDRDS